VILVWLFSPPKATFGEGATLFREEYRRMGRISFEQGMVLGLFTLLACLWMFRRDLSIGVVTLPGWSTLLPAPGFIDDGTVAIGVATLLFLLPARSAKGNRLMNWKNAAGLNWRIVVLFGGGFALAAGFEQSGLSQ